MIMSLSRQRKSWRGHELTTKEDIARLERDTKEDFARLELGGKGEFGRLAAEIEKPRRAGKPSLTSL